MNNQTNPAASLPESLVAVAHNLASSSGAPRPLFDDLQTADHLHLHLYPMTGAQTFALLLQQYRIEFGNDRHHPSRVCLDA